MIINIQEISKMQIAEKTIVSIRYTIKNNRGEEIENTMAGPAVKYLHGSGNILPQLEASLVGLKAGDKKSITIQIPDSFSFDIEIDDVRMATEDEMQSGKPGKENNCGPDCCC
jgi:FKBP-type peptidyl-prolyl cis-trans isomerase SlyD